MGGEPQFMRELKVSFRSYLSKTGKIGEIPLGNSKPKNLDNKLFRSELKKLSKINDIFIISAFVILIILFAVGIYLTLLHRNNPSKITAIFGGTFLSLLIIVRKLRQFWLEKFIMDHSSIVLQNFSPEQAADFILNLYKNFMLNPKDKKKHN